MKVDHTRKINVKNDVPVEYNKIVFQTFHLIQRTRRSQRLGFGVIGYFAPKTLPAAKVIFYVLTKMPNANNDVG